jgi:hypothetical protein
MFAVLIRCLGQVAVHEVPPVKGRSILFCQRDRHHGKIQRLNMSVLLA